MKYQIRDITPKGNICKGNQPKNSSIHLEGYFMSSFVVRFVTASQCTLIISECRKLTGKNRKRHINEKLSFSDGSRHFFLSTLEECNLCTSNLLVIFGTVFFWRLSVRVRPILPKCSSKNSSTVKTTRFDFCVVNFNSTQSPSSLRIRSQYVTLKISVVLIFFCPKTSTRCETLEKN